MCNLFCLCCKTTISGPGFEVFTSPIAGDWWEPKPDGAKSQITFPFKPFKVLIDAVWMDKESDQPNIISFIPSPFTSKIAGSHSHPHSRVSPRKLEHL